MYIPTEAVQAYKEGDAGTQLQPEITTLSGMRQVQMEKNCVISLCEILKSDLMAFVGKWYPEAGGGRGRLGKGELV